MLTARAKGTAERRIVLAHALRNAGGRTIFVTGREAICALACYTVVLETVFAWPGLGSLAIAAIQNQDLVLLQGIVVTTALMVVGLNIVMDGLQRTVDARIGA